MILSIADDGQTLTQRCDAPGCGAERTLRLDPRFGELRIDDDALSLGDTATLAPCAQCGSVECVRLDISAYEAGEAPQPGSTAGDVLPGGGVVHEHTVGYSPDHRLQLQAQLLRRFAAHPHMKNARAAAMGRAEAARQKGHLPH